MPAIAVTIRAIGNSKGVVLPKTVLAQAGLEDVTDAELLVENGVILLRKAAPRVREGWAEAAARVSTQGGDALVMGEFGNEGDEDLAW
ncbi:antitoxin MazE [Pseudacidovorax sp. 1753]